MNTGRARIGILLTVLALCSACATQQPRAILSAAELDAMIRIEVSVVEPIEPLAVMATNE
jgi:hypothetical protein